MLFASNYKPGTFLIGWDSLQTELNPLLAVKRSLYAVWEEYQSFGLTSGMAHAADLIRAVLLWMVSFVLPKSVVRYFFHFLMIYVGGLGLFKLLKYLGFSEEKQNLAFIGAVFYILNLGTAQIMSLPFEPFSVFFGLLPWEIYLFLKFAYAEKLTPSLLFKLVLVNILATPQAYLQTLFVVYMLCLGLLAFGMFMEKYNTNLIKRFIIAFGLIISVNLFWILPQVYFLSTSLDVVKESKINQLATEIVSKQNQEKGTIRNFARLEGFYFDLYDTEGNLIFEPWHNHYGNFFIAALSYVPFIVLLIGFFKKHRSHYGFIAIFVVISLILLSNTRFFSHINTLIFSQGFISQIFRSPFTKFVVPYSLVYSYLFVSGLETVNKKILESSKQNKTIESIIFTSTIILLIIIYALPAFLGYYFASRAKVRVPDSYLHVIDYFGGQDKNKRVALLPEYTFWGWFNMNWGYDGSGFLWYGVEQPIISRTFDVWSLSSESYFWEMKYAIESIRVDLFENVLEKYAVDYLVLDHNLKAISSVDEGLQYDQLEKLFEQTKKVVFVQAFDRMEIYKVNHDKAADEFVSFADDLPTVAPLIQLTNYDQAFTDLGSYKVIPIDADYTVLQEPEFYYPFLDLTTQTNLTEKHWKISENEKEFILTADLVGLHTANYVSVENSVPKAFEVYLDGALHQAEYDIKTELIGNSLIVKINKEFVERFDPTFVEVNNCRGTGNFGVIKRGATLSVESQERGVACFGYSSSLLDHWNGYLIKVESQNIVGNNLFFYVFGNNSRKQSKLETNLNGGTEYFILNPGYYYDDGYFFSFQNSSYETLKSENLLKQLDLYLFPFEYIKNIKLIRKDLINIDLDNQDNDQGSLRDAVSFNRASFAQFSSANKINYYTYRVDKIDNAYQELILNQSFSPGWRVYLMRDAGFFAENFPYFFGELLGDHFLVNNWANGWKVPELAAGEYILLVFWPQVLEYYGMIVLFVVWNYVFIRVLIRLRRGRLVHSLVNEEVTNSADQEKQ
ncbi:MAG: hypothetical protein JW922_03380 [Paludibacteraceae bacterium]|nr:hypothetical protein [Paludibacteraceae bacterium]